MGSQIRLLRSHTVKIRSILGPSVQLCGELSTDEITVESLRQNIGEEYPAIPVCKIISHTEPSLVRVGLVLYSFTYRKDT